MANIPIDKLDKILDELSGLRIKEAVSLRKRLQKEKQRLIPKESFVKPVDHTSVNQKRSRKLKRYWRYIKLIRDNFPNYTTNQIRTQLKKRKRDGNSDIPDAVWQNPSA